MADKPSKAAVEFESLSQSDKLSLLREVFCILEYDEEGEPGCEWSSDTTQYLGETFEKYGVVFTPPEV
jgi:hypothetical protein